MKKLNLRAFAVTAIMSAVGFVLMLLEFPLPIIIPSFIKFDFSEIPALITAFALGPWYAVAVCLLKNLLHVFYSHSAGAGELANFLLGAIFVLVCGYFYKFKKTRKTALVSCLVGAFAMALLSFPVNYYIVYPFYFRFMPEESVVDLYKAIVPAADTLIKDLLIFNLPFTFMKGIIDSAICFVVYKKLSPIIKNKG